MNNELSTLMQRIIRRIRVEIGEEIDQNFSRQAFFNEAWSRRKSPMRGNGALLVDSGSLRSSITSRVSGSSITFFSLLPYAAIHNEGGEIKVTPKMKKYFWHRYYETSERFGRKKDGRLRDDKRNRRLSSEADFWRLMALMKVGKSIKIPRRQFIGLSPEVEQTVTSIIEDNLSQYFAQYNLKS